MAFIELNNVSAGYGKNTILKDFNLSIEEGKLVSLLGPSGCGKTTTLRLIAGFIDASGGQFLLEGKDYTRVPVHKRNFGYVFQSYALFPHLNIYENVAFGLKLRKVGRDEMQRRVKEALASVALEGYETRLPGELSGGQRQRVALARALVINPRILLLDEPLSNLDAKLRVQMRVEILRLQKELGITTVYVTHDQEECFSISDQVAIMNGGIIEQLDSPFNIYHHPATAFTAKFVGFENFVNLKWENGAYRSGAGVAFGMENLGQDEVKCACRPDDLILSTADVTPDGLYVDGTVGVCTFLGKQLQYLVNTKEGNFYVNTEIGNHFENGQAVKVLFPADKVVFCTK